MNNKIVLNQGYGAFLTKIYFENGVVIKKSINNQGNIRITEEINFYNFVKDKPFGFLVPNIFMVDDKSFHMEYLENYITIEKHLRNIDNTDKTCQIVHFIKKILNEKLYIENKNIDFNTYKKNLILETTEKILSRNKTINFIIEKYSFIKKVNGIKIMDLDTILSKIKVLIETYLKTAELIYFPVHGDLQLNNILINPENNNIKFIDPRGYFGESKIYGMKEYDYAKLYFGLSGYSYFDLKEVTNLNIINDSGNIIIDMKEIITIQGQSHIIQLLIICIWLGNAHCFITNELKVVESYFYALYLATIYLDNLDKTI